MKIVIPGGSGYLGRLLASHFAAQSHEVAVLTREPVDQPKDYIQYAWDGRSLGSWAHAFEGADAIINLAGKSVNCRYNEANKAAIYASRLDSTRVVGEAIAAVKQPPRVWINSSSATIYRHAEDRPMDEETGEIGTGFSVDVCQQWEKAFFDAPTPQTRKVATRTAMVMGAGEGGPFDVFYKLAKLGLGGAMGSGGQFVSWIHADDFARAIEWLIERDDIEGVINLSSANPLPNKDFMREIRRAVGVPIGLPAPKPLLEIGALFMGTETELPLKSRRVVPTKLLATGFHLQHPTWPEAAKDLVKRASAQR